MSLSLSNQFRVGDIKVFHVVCIEFEHYAVVQGNILQLAEGEVVRRKAASRLTTMSSVCLPPRLDYMHAT